MQSIPTTDDYWTFDTQSDGRFCVKQFEKKNFLIISVNTTLINQENLLPWWASEFGKLTHRIWKNFPWKTVVLLTTVAGVTLLFPPLQNLSQRLCTGIATFSPPCRCLLSITGGDFMIAHWLWGDIVLVWGDFFAIAGSNKVTPA